MTAYDESDVAIHGFTLVEVLVALLILAIALLAIMSALSSSVRNLNRLQDTMAASWVADNVVSELQLGMLNLNGQGAQGSIAMGQQTWGWHANLLQQYTTYASVAVQVYAPDQTHPTQTVTAYVSHTQS